MKNNTSPKGLYRQRLVNMNDEHGAQLVEDKAQHRAALYLVNILVILHF